MSKQNISNTILANPNLIIGIPPKSLNQGRTLMTRILGLIQTLFAQKGFIYLIKVSGTSREA
jgi:hypothetical protein